MGEPSGEGGVGEHLRGGVGSIRGGGGGGGVGEHSREEGWGLKHI